VDRGSRVTDQLTGVDGRAAFVGRVEQAVGEFRRGDPPAVLTVDLDDFATVNDVLGYATGDQVLAAVAAVLRDAGDRVAAVGRLDGDQFGLREVRELGVRIALDDFGTGPASLPALASAPIDMIKLHGSIAEQIVTSPPAATVARGVARLADELGIAAVAKAVQSAAQAERLHELGYREGMGFPFAVPQPATAIPLFLAAGESFLAALS
jgi:predicted signal transduction protein with EAL and GGDEF domain